MLKLKMRLPIICKETKEICRTYDAYLKSEHWSRFRRKALKAGKEQGCERCGVSHVEVHHITYRNLGNETLKDVVLLCRTHHQMAHDWFAFGYSKKKPGALLKMAHQCEREPGISRVRINGVFFNISDLEQESKYYQKPIR